MARSIRIRIIKSIVKSPRPGWLTAHWKFNYTPSSPGGLTCANVSFVPSEWECWKKFATAVSDSIFGGTIAFSDGGIMDLQAVFWWLVSQGRFRVRGSMRTMQFSAACLRFSWIARRVFFVLFDTFRESGLRYRGGQYGGGYQMLLHFTAYINELKSCAHP